MMKKEESWFQKHRQLLATTLIAFITLTMLTVLFAPMIRTPSEETNPSPTPTTPTTTTLPPYKPERQIEIPLDASPEDRLIVSMYNQGWRLFNYGTCRFCVVQHEILGGAYQYVNAIECLDENTMYLTQECQDLGIMAFPAWASPEGELHIGAHNFTMLSEISGVEYP